MSVSETQLHAHLGANPAFFGQIEKRREVQKYNREAKAYNLLMRAIEPKSPLLMSMSPPKQPNKYIPHYGAKEAAKYAGRVAL